MTEGYLEERPISHGFGSTVELSTKADQWLQELLRRKNKEEDPVLQLLPNQELQGAEKESIRAPISICVSQYVSRSVANIKLILCKLKRNN